MNDYGLDLAVIGNGRIAARKMKLGHSSNRSLSRVSPISRGVGFSERLFPLAAMSADLGAEARLAGPSLQSFSDDKGRATVSSGFLSAATPQIISMMEARNISAEPNR